MIDGLKGMLETLLGDLIGKTANSSPCGIDTMIGNVVGGVLGTLQNGVQGALSGVNNTISGR